MNLLFDPWIPVIRQSGKQEKIAPWQIAESDDPVIELNAPRPDFNGALLEFLVGVIQTISPPTDHNDWVDMLESPPSGDYLKEKFNKHQKFFELEGDNVRFMQETGIEVDVHDKKFNPISYLLIDSPTDNTLKDNKDHFVKRDRVKNICKSCTATALISLQNFAPSGGNGHFTSIRGGGPLTTMVMFDSENNKECVSLWKNIIFNVIEKRYFYDEDNINESNVFPWVEPKKYIKEFLKRKVYLEDVSKLHVFWGMPRRIFIDFKNIKFAECDLCGQTNQNCVTRYVTKPQGIQYTDTGWEHPLTPYYVDNKDVGVTRPTHLHPGGFIYRFWPKITIGDEYHLLAKVVQHFLVYRKEINEQTIVNAFGYDMENMKARCWYEATIPNYLMEQEKRSIFESRVGMAVSAAEQVANHIIKCIKEAWLDSDPKKNKERKNKINEKLSYIYESFFQSTESDFRLMLKELSGSNNDLTKLETFDKWKRVLQKVAFFEFNHWVSKSDFSVCDIRRISKAHNKLQDIFNSKKFLTTLMLNNKKEKVA